MKIGLIAWILAAFLMTFQINAFASGLQIAMHVTDKIEYEGLSMEFCERVGQEAYLYKLKGTPIFDLQDAITNGLERNKDLFPLQRIVAMRIARVLSSRIYAEIPVNSQAEVDVKALSRIECIEGNHLIQGLTALKILTNSK